MKVKLFDMNNDQAVPPHIVDLADCFDLPNDEPEYHAASYELQANGRVWIGGGAAPLFLLTLEVTP